MSVLMSHQFRSVWKSALSRTTYLALISVL